ncbi:MAG: hypothetical protein A2297_03525 [Elusimicrobia bacterium RIFOXYB2_FULL_48_7]|nr:MAG: hypothetical protein A2297_03525 [Elusimicrobia bacterium RIFOXYB2_FULL_48_7]
MEKTILHIDMNAFFASVEQACNPFLRGKPIAVCGEIAKGSKYPRTIITTSSYEARAMGVKGILTIPEAKALCPNLILVPGNLDKYIDVSLKIQKILLDFTDTVEVFSIDECFMDVTDILKFYKDDSPANAIAKQIKARIKKELGLLCSVGIAPNKLLAKLASDMKKPDGLYEIKTEDIPAVLENLPIEDLCGIGRHLQERLNFLGIRTAKQLGETPVGLLTHHFGFIGYSLKQMGKGIDHSSVKNYRDQDTVKSVGHSHTLTQDTWDLEVVKSYMYMLSEKVSVRLRQYKMAGKVVSLVVRYSDFETFGRQKCLGSYIKNGKDIYDTAFALFEEKFRFEKAVRLLGVSISGLVVDAGEQYLMENLQKRDTMTAVVDEINSKYGEFTVKPSSLIIAENFGILGRCGIMSKRLIK